MNNKVILIRTPKGSPITNDVNPKEYYYTDYFEDLGVSYLAGSLIEKGYIVEIIDTEQDRLSEMEIARRSVKPDVKIYAVSVHAYDFIKVALRIIVEIKKIQRDSIIILGGHPVSEIADNLMQEVRFIDYICRGEGEITLPELVSTIINDGNPMMVDGINYRDSNGCVKKTKDRERITDLDSIPFPYRYIFENDKIQHPYYAMIYGSRGCYGNCTMCSVCTFYNNNHHWIPRSAENIVQEICEVHKRYGVKIFSMIDADFIGPGAIGKDRAFTFAKLIQEKNLDIRFDIACRVDDVDESLFRELKRAGLYNVFLGVESGINSVLNYLRKGTTVDDNLRAMAILDNLGIDVEVGFIMIFPDTSISEIKKNLQFIRRIKVFQPYRLGSRLFTNPGFDITKELEKNNVVKGNFLEKHYAINDRAVYLYYMLWKSLYSHALDIMNRLNLLQLHSLWDEKLLRYIRNTEIEIVSLMIDALENGIRYIEQEKYDENIELLICDDFKKCMVLFRNRIDKITKNIRHLSKYSWINRKVDI